VKSATASEIENALKSGDIAKLKKWVNYGQRFKRTCFNMTAGNNRMLQKAAKYGHFEVIKWLVECGQKVCLENRRHWDKFSNNSSNSAGTAANHKHYEIAKWLVQHPSASMSDRALISLLSTVAMFNTLDSCDFEFVKWIIIYIVPRVKQENLHAIPMALSIREFDISRWEFLIKDSGLIIDCRNCEDWEFFDLHTGSMADETRRYILSVKEMQIASGLENWITAYVQQKDSVKQRRY